MPKKWIQRTYSNFSNVTCSISPPLARHFTSNVSSGRRMSSMQFFFCRAAHLVSSLASQSGPAQTLVIGGKSLSADLAWPIALKTRIRNWITGFHKINNHSCLSWFKIILHTSFILYNKLHDRHPLSILVFPQTSIISSIFRCYLWITSMNSKMNIKIRDIVHMIYYSKK